VTFILQRAYSRVGPLSVRRKPNSEKKQVEMGWCSSHHVGGGEDRNENRKGHFRVKKNSIRAEWRRLGTVSQKTEEAARAGYR